MKLAYVGPVFLVLATSCASYVDIKSPAKGSVDNPVLCDMPLGQQVYLRRLQGPKGEKIQYEYLDAVIGPKGKVLDRFAISNPTYESSRRNIIDIIADFFRKTPLLPAEFRIYMDMYNPGVLDPVPVPGYQLEQLVK